MSKAGARRRQRNQRQQSRSAIERPSTRSEGAPSRAVGRRASRRRWLTGPLPTVAAVLVVGAVIVAFVIMSRAGQEGSRPTSHDASAAVVSDVTGVSPGIIDAVGSGGLKNPLKPATQSPPLAGPSGKPEVLYIGAEYCPYCAAERWSLVVALSRFGSFQNLGLTSSASDDIYPSTPTFTFYGSSFQSSSIEFASVELQKRDRSPLQAPTAEQQRLMSASDPQGSIPFIDVGGRYVGIGSGYVPDVLSGKDAQQIANALSDQQSPITRAVVGNANWLTAGICQATGGQPQSVCNDPAIQSLEAQFGG